MSYYLAIDIGASSGRHIVDWKEDGAVYTKEVYRFPNGINLENGHLVWDVRKLFSNVVTGIMESKFKETVGLVYWLVLTAIYLLWSFTTNAWNITWLVFAVGGVLFAALMAICNLFINRNDQ